jgi:hypothetical protein
MRMLAAIVLGLPATAYGWVVAASALYLTAADKFDLFQFPYLQWVQAAPYWQANPWMTVYVVGSAVIPTVVVALCLFGMVRHRQNRQPAVYGETQWATPQQHSANGISSNRKPF